MRRLFRAMPPVSIVLLIVPAALIGFGAGCGNPAQPSGLSAADLTKVTSAVGEVVFLAIGQALSAMSGSSAARVHQPAGLIPTIAPGPGEVSPVNVTTGCPDSGTAAVSGNVTSTVNDSGTGTGSFSMAVTFANCSAEGIFVQGNPNVTVAGQINLLNFALVNPVPLTLGSGALFTLNSQDGSMEFNCTISMDASTFVSTATGNVTVQYPRGKNGSAVPCSQFVQ